MAALTVQEITRDGLTPALSAADVAGDTVANSGKEFVEVKNDDASSITVTLDIQTTVDGQAVTDRTVSVAAGARALIGPFPRVNYNDGDGNVNISYSSVTSVTVGAFKLP